MSAAAQPLRVNLERDARRAEMDESVRAVRRTFRGANDEHGGDVACHEDGTTPCHKLGTTPAGPDPKTVESGTAYLRSVSMA
jgi:hypothetical protein